MLLVIFQLLEFMETRTVIKLHLIFWIIVLAIYVLGSLTYIENPLFIPLLASSLMIYSYVCVTFYLFYNALSPAFFNRTGIILYVLSGLLYLVVCTYLFTLAAYYPYVYLYPPPVPSEMTSGLWISSYIFEVITAAIIFAILGSLSKLSLIWYRNKLKQMETEKQNMYNELAMLRAQINPHFLFNTLNNIKSLTISLPSKAILSIEKLNSIMNYMLYESSMEQVPLASEIGYINNYLDLQKIRYSTHGFIDFSISGDFSGIHVPPLIFMPFIENAFKHGDKMKPDPGITIRLDIEKSRIFFEITNFIKESDEVKSRNSGFGLPNIRRRLDLLFERRYSLEIDTINDQFSVKLNLFLS